LAPVLLSQLVENAGRFPESEDLVLAADETGVCRNFVKHSKNNLGWEGISCGTSPRRFYRTGGETGRITAALRAGSRLRSKRRKEQRACVFQRSRSGRPSCTRSGKFGTWPSDVSRSRSAETPRSCPS